MTDLKGFDTSKVKVEAEVEEEEVKKRIQEAQEERDYFDARVNEVKARATKKSKSDKKSNSESKLPSDAESDTEDEGGGGDGSDAGLMVEIIKESAKEFFVDQYEAPYVAIEIDKRLETLAMGKKRFKNLVGGMFYDETESVPKAENISAAINILRYLAGKGGHKKLYERLAPIDARNITKGIIYDMTNPEWQCVRITPFGWAMDSCPVIFRRHNNEHPQVQPIKKYPKDIFDQFMKLLNIKGDENKLLMKCYIVTLFVPEIQKPILMLHGEQGAAKSTLQEIIKTLIDPRSVLTLSFPGKQEEMIQQLSHNYVAFYDNISQIKEWISNILCRSVTGSGFSKRQLYTDDDDIIYQFRRAIGFNGINLAATKADLLDRGLIMLLSRLTEEQQKNIGEIMEKFMEIRPKVLACIFDILVKALELRSRNVVKLDKLPRMAEFAIWGEIVSQAMGNVSMEFTEAYKNNRRLQAVQVVETSPVAMCLSEFMDYSIEEFKKDKECTVDLKKHFKDLGENTNTYQWHGPATELFNQLTFRAMSNRIPTNSKSWPGAPHILSRRLTEVRATLKEIGISIDFERDEKKREIMVTKVASEASGDQNRAQKEASEHDATKEADATSVIGKEVASFSRDGNRAQISSDKGEHDATDANDVILSTNISLMGKDTDTNNKSNRTCRRCDPNVDFDGIFDYRYHMENAHEVQWEQTRTD